MSIAKEFREFAVKGNMVDLAIGVIIGAAFGRIVTSLVQDIIMPPLAYITGGVDYRDLKYVIEPAQMDATGNVILAEVAINYGNFFQVLLDFFIIALIIFMVIKGFNTMRKKAEDPKNPEVPAPKDIMLLTEIRDILKNK